MLNTGNYYKKKQCIHFAGNSEIGFIVGPRNYGKTNNTLDWTFHSNWIPFETPIQSHRINGYITIYPHKENGYTKFKDGDVIIEN